MLKTLKRLGRSLIGIRNDTDFYSQGGEDAIVWNTFAYMTSIRSGSYLDIGAYHPFKHSNTYLLYKAGWKGFNIDPRPGSKALFDRYRKRDINIEAGVAAEDGTMTYYIVGESSTMNTFSKENLERLGLIDEVIRTVEVPVYSLASLSKKWPGAGEVNYLNIDAEGFEMEILRGLPEVSRLPEVISLEQNNVTTLKDVLESEPCSFLAELDYVPYAKNIILQRVATVFYIRES